MPKIDNLRAAFVCPNLYAGWRCLKRSFETIFVTNAPFGIKISTSTEADVRSIDLRSGQFACSGGKRG